MFARSSNRTKGFDGDIWDTASALLRTASIWTTLPAASLVKPAALAVAAVQPLLKLQYAASSCVELEVPLIAIATAESLCSMLVAACGGNAQHTCDSEAGSSGGPLPGVVWEGMAVCCSAMQYIHDREVCGAHAASSSTAARGIADPHAAETRRVVVTHSVGALTDLLNQLGAYIARHFKLAVAGENVGAATAGVEAMLRLCGRLWQGAEQLQGILGREAILQLGSAAACMQVAPMALSWGHSRNTSPHQQDCESLGWWATLSLAKLVLLFPMHAQGGFPAVKLRGLLLRLCFHLSRLVSIRLNNAVANFTLER